MRKFTILITIFLISICVIAEDKTIEEVTKEIELIKQIQNLTRNTSWTPGVTDISFYSNKDQETICGLKMDTEWQPRKEDNPVKVKGYVDLRGKGIITSIKNQGRCGSCWAFAMIACVEAENGGGINLSEQELVSCCTSSNGCGGGYIGSTASWLINNGGVLSESVYPYRSGSSGQTGTCQKKSGAKATISGYSSCYSNNSVKAALDRGHPVDTGMYVYADFMNYKSGIYRHTSGSYKGGHAVTIVGYDDSNQCWIVKNSWGTNWGERGYFRIAYNQCKMPWMAVYVRK